VRYFPLFADLHGPARARRRRRRRRRAQGAVAARGGCARRAGCSRTDRMAAGEGTVACRARFDPAQLAGATLVVAATSDLQSMPRLPRRARERRVLVNVVDDAELSSFIVPAIVDRSPLVIAISSGGVAPCSPGTFASGWNPCSTSPLGTLAGMLQRWRERIKRALPDLDARRVSTRR